MKEIRLSAELEVWGLNQVDAAVLHHQIFVAGSYERHGVAVAPGACVFDVGANIGLYSMWLASRHRELRLFLFEPVPEVFAALERNTGTLAGSETHLFCCGLADRQGEAGFEYDRMLSSTASMFPDTLERSRRRASAHQWVRAALALLARAGVIPRPLRRGLDAMLGWPATRWLALALLFPLGVALAGWRRLARRRVHCQLRTVSEIIAERGVDRIDLLKIDVEGSEEQVLAGIEERDWPKVEQLIVEVSDIDGRVASVAAGLRRRGFSVTVDQDDDELLRLCGLFHIYATRAPAG